MSTQQQLQVDFLKLVFDAFPAPVFLVDKELWILDYNAAATRRFSIASDAKLHWRLGDVQHCRHAQDVELGCGCSPSCRCCGLRNAILEAVVGKPVVRLHQRLELIHYGQVSELEALITTSLFPLPESSAVLVVLEDINEVTKLQEQQLDRWSRCVGTHTAAVPVVQAPKPSNVHGARLARAESLAEIAHHSEHSAGPTGQRLQRVMEQLQRRRREYGYW